LRLGAPATALDTRERVVLVDERPVHAPRALNERGGAGRDGRAQRLHPRAAKSHSTVPYLWSDWYGSCLQFVGVPECDAVETVLDLPEAERLVTLYRRDDRVVGAFTLNGQAEIMNYRALISARTSWGEALAFARQRSDRAMARAATLKGDRFGGGGQ
jgi:hypothetical protein